MKDDLIYNRFNSIKTLYYSDRLKEIVERGITSPVIMHIYPTNKCTHDCSFCIMKDERVSLDELDREFMLGSILNACELGIKAIHFSGGGEPMLNKATEEAMEYSKELGLQVICSTNGSVKIPNCSSVRISLNAGTKETHEKIMRAKTWNKIIKNIKEYKDKDKIGLGFIATEDNYKEVYKFCKLANNLGVNFVHIRPAYLPERDKEIQETIPFIVGQTNEAKKDFPELNIYSISEKFDGYWTERKYKKCLATPMNIVMKANGQLIPCQDRLDLEFGKGVESWGSKKHFETMNNICIDECPRCVMTKINEYIENIFINDNTLRNII